MTMNAALCEKVGKGAFPTAAEVARWQLNALQAECGLGYRAKHIVRLAEQVTHFAPISLSAFNLKCISMHQY